MKLKYYLRGMGIGIILTAIVMGFALGGRKATISDAEVIRRAKELGMIEAGTGVLSQTSTEAGQNNDKTDTSSSDTPLGKTGEKIPEEVDQEVPGADQPVSDLDGETQEGQDTQTEEGGAETESSDDDAQGAAERPVMTTGTASADSTSESVSESTAKSSEESATDVASNSSTSDTTESAASASTSSENTETASAAADGKTITIPGGLGSEAVSAILAREGLIDNAGSFNAYLVDRRIDRIIRSGVKTIPEGASYEQIADIITR